MSDPRTSSFVLLTMCIVGTVLGNLAESYKGSDSNWIYKYGKTISQILVYVAVTWSIINIIIIILKPGWRSKRAFLFLSSLPIIYYLIIYVLINQT